MTKPAKGHLAALIEQLADERGWSLREVARRSNLPAPTVQKIASSNSITIPRRETLNALAKGLSVPLSTLMDAAAKDSGYKAHYTNTDESTSIVIAAMDELSAQRRAEIAALAVAMLQTERAHQVE